MKHAGQKWGAVALPVITTVLLLWLIGRTSSQPLANIPARAPNLLTNTSFQKTTKDFPDSWYLDGPLAEKGSVKIVRGGSKPENLSLCLLPNSRNTDPGKPFALAQILYPEPFLGHKLLVQASIKSASGAAGHVHLFALSHGKPVAQATLSQSASDAGFVKQQDTLQVPASSDQLFFIVTTSSVTGSACFDDLGVFVTDPDSTTAAKQYPPAASPAASTTLPPVTVSSAPAAATPAAQTAPSRSSGMEPTGANLLKNADFRHKAKNLPEDWILDNSLAAKGSVSIDQGGSKPGDLSVRLTPNSRNSDGAKPFALAQMVSAVEVRGQRLEVSASLKVTPGGTAFVHLFALAGDRLVGQATFNQTTPSTTFVAHQDYLNVPNNADRLLFAITTNSVTGSASFADLRVSAVPESAPPPAREISNGSSIRVNAAQVLRQIPPGLFGTNVEWVRNGNGIWDSATNRPRPEIVNRLREAGVSVIRYPGGGLADHFHWRDSIGPIHFRPVRPHVLDPESSQLVFGMAELMTLCRMIGAEPLITVNITEGTAQEAADWVAYCNRPVNAERERNGSKAPYNVKYWEIGNEQYIDNPSSGIPSSYLPPDQYVRRFREFVAAMKAVDPNIVIGAIGGVNFGAYNSLKDNDWDTRLLSATGGTVDFLSVHNGYAPLVGDNPRLQFFDVYKAMMAFSSQAEANLAQLSAQLGSYGTATRNTKIAVTEWGPLFAAGIKSPWAGHPKTLGSALYVASIFNAFLRSPRVEIATYLKATEDNYMGWLYPNGAEKPSFQVLRLYWQHLGTRLTDTRVNSPSFSSPALGSVTAASNTPYLDAVSGLNDSGSRLTLIVVNRDFANAWSTAIQIDGFSPASNGKAWELAADSLDANNGEDLDPRLPWAQQAQAPRSGLYSRGRPGTVMPKERAVSGLSSSFNYTFPPRSVTVLEMTAAR